MATNFGAVEAVKICLDCHLFIPAWFRQIHQGFLKPGFYWVLGITSLFLKLVG
jgi:hypothetical protein